MKYSRSVAARPANVTEASVATDAIVPGAFTAPGAARTGWSADCGITELYSLHYQRLVRLAVLLVRDVPTAEEVVQDSFVATHGGWQRLRDSTSALAYLRQAVVNRSRSVLRHRAVVDKNLQQPPPDMPSAEHDALVLLERSAVVTALHKLPGRQREAIVLRYYADFSEAEVAAAMGISRGAVKSHTARAMAALRAELEQQSWAHRAAAGRSPVPQRSSGSTARAPARRVTSTKTSGALAGTVAEVRPRHNTADTQ
jgi:RNA polymerase sigma-70 factor (sigma-E family)